MASLNRQPHSHRSAWTRSTAINDRVHINPWKSSGIQTMLFLQQSDAPAHTKVASLFSFSPRSRLLGAPCLAFETWVCRMSAHNQTPSKPAPPLLQTSLPLDSRRPIKLETRDHCIAAERRDKTSTSPPLTLHRSRSSIKKYGRGGPRVHAALHLRYPSHVLQLSRTGATA